jgi:hypothetical protein
MIRVLARRTVRFQQVRTFAARRRGGTGNGRGRRSNNNNNNNNNKSLVRGNDYEEPSESAATGMMYRLVGALGASAAVTGYLYFVYNPGMGDRRFGRQKRENEEYFEGDHFQEGDWDGGLTGDNDIGLGAGEGMGGSDGESGGIGRDDPFGFGGNSTSGEYDEENGDSDPYAINNNSGQDRYRRRGPSTEASNRGTWA